MMYPPSTEAEQAITLPHSGSPCTSCGLCAAVCPTKAISMQLNHFGFLRPSIDYEKCIHCHACERACAKLPDNEYHPIAAFSGYTLDDETRYRSSSGGIAYELARHILTQQGIVFGVTLDTDLKAKFIAVTTLAELPKIQGSIYLQADTTGCYRQIHQALKTGKPVLLTCLPCQARAARVRFGNRYDNLYILDLACYGPPSYKLLETAIIKTNSKKVINIRFRDKETGWHGSLLRLCYADGTSRTLPRKTDAFRQFFNVGICINDSCYSCPYILEHRASDLSTGDYWGKRIKEAGDEQGVSCIAVHTEKGKEMLSWLEDTCRISETPVEDIRKINEGMRSGEHRIPIAYPEFMEMLSDDVPAEVLLHKFMARTLVLRRGVRIHGKLILCPAWIQNVCYAFLWFYRMTHGFVCRRIPRYTRQALKRFRLR